MVELIQELLLTHNCVIIPGLGAFLGNYNPAEIHLAENKIYPPGKTIAFNRTLKVNDGLLINALSQHSGVSYLMAEKLVNAFSKECQDSLLINKSVIIKNIGKLVLDDQESIQFQPYTQRNYLPESFGLESLSLYPIQRLKDTSDIVKENYQRILHPEKMEDAVTPVRLFSKIPYWITAILAILFFASTLGWNIHKSNLDQSYSSLFPSFNNSPKPTIHPPKKISKPDEILIQSANTITIPETTVQEVIIPDPPVQVVNSPDPSFNKSYIVVGAFFDEIHANKVKAEAEAKGYVIKMTRDYDNIIFRVSVEVENQNVEVTLEKIKSDFNKRAWVYCTNCKLI